MAAWARRSQHGGGVVAYSTGARAGSAATHALGGVSLLACACWRERGKWSVDTTRAKQNGSKKDGLELGESSYGDNLSSISLLQACNASQHGTHYPVAVGRERAVLYGQDKRAEDGPFRTLVKDQTEGAI